MTDNRALPNIVQAQSVSRPSPLRLARPMSSHNDKGLGGSTTLPQPLDADTLNAHLLSGGVVQVSTYLRSTLYRQKHAGMFYQAANGDLRVKSGRSSVCLGTKTTLLVHIRLGRAA